jgi:hypothetical protein
MAISVCFLQTENGMANFRMFAANRNRQHKFVSLGRQTITVN